MILQCRHFGICGSCTLFEISYQEELQSKQGRVEVLLQPYYAERFSIYDSAQEYYRARAEFRIWHEEGVCHYAMSRWDKKGSIMITECPKVIMPIQKRMWSLLEQVNRSNLLARKLFGIEFLATTTDACLVTMLYHRKLDADWEIEAKALESLLNVTIIGRSRKQKVLLSDPYVIEQLTIDNREYKYRYYEGGFTQPNPGVNVKMIEWVLSRIAGDSRRDLLESYCGLGNFTLPLSTQFTKVLATEISKNSIKAAKENCRLNEVENISFARLSSEEMTQALTGVRLFRRLEGIDLKAYDFSHVLVDPPRAGLDRDTIRLISGIETILYVSCNPETLARDLGVLAQTHEVTDAALFDQFPHTSHIESAVVLRRRT